MIGRPILLYITMSCSIHHIRFKRKQWKMECVQQSNAHIVHYLMIKPHTLSTIKVFATTHSSNLQGAFKQYHDHFLDEDLSFHVILANGYKSIIERNSISLLL